MIKLFRVRGASMHPEYGNGDYVLVRRYSKRPRGRQPQTGDDVICRHPKLGTILKRISAQTAQGVTLKGLNGLSSDSSAIGEVPYHLLAGRVVARIPQKH